jgi:hypothetical protein
VDIITGVGAPINLLGRNSAQCAKLGDTTQVTHCTPVFSRLLADPP